MTTEATTRKPYPSDVSDEEWALVAPYLTLMSAEAPQREHSLREVFNGLRWIVRTGAQWRWLPHDLPPWYTVYQQADAALAARGRVRRYRPRPARGAAPGPGPRGSPLGRGAGWPHPAIDARERSAGGLRRPQAPQGLQSPHRRGHAGALAGPARDRRQRPGARAGRRPGRARAGGHGRDGRDCLRR